jgi:hypothetical protein
MRAPSVSPVVRRWLRLILISAVGTLATVGVAVYLTWPDNRVGDHVRVWQAQRETIRALERRVAGESDPLIRRYYAAWLSEERGDVPEAIREFRALRDQASPGTDLHLHCSLRLGLAYGLNREPERELAVYRDLLARYPGASRLSQATFHLRRGEAAPARRLLTEALAQDAADRSLGASRPMAQAILDEIRSQGVPPARGGERP